MLRRIGIVSCLIGLLLSGRAIAEDAGMIGLRAAVAELRDEVTAQRDLEQRLTAIEHQLQFQAQSQPKFLAGFDKGKFFLQSEDGDYRMTIGGRIHFHGVFPLDGPSEGTSDILIRRIRTVIEGHLAKHYQYKIEYEFGRERQPTLTDGFINFAHMSEAQLRLGKFKVPFSVEELTSSNSIRFVERSIVSRSFAPSRMIGVMAHGRTGILGYQAGTFSGSETGHFLYAGRVTVQATPNLTFGANAFREHNDGRNLNAINYSTELGTRFFRYASGAVSDGSRTNYGFDLSYWGTPLGFVAEYLINEQDVRLGGNSKKLANDGWLVQGSYVLTGENATARGVTPAKNFDPANGGWGAVELAARYAVVNFDSSAFPTFATGASVEDVQSIAAGINWYLNRNVRLMLNYVHNRFDDKISGDKSENGILARVQLAF